MIKYTKSGLTSFYYRIRKDIKRLIKEGFYMLFGKKKQEQNIDTFIMMQTQATHDGYYNPQEIIPIIPELSNIWRSLEELFLELPPTVEPQDMESIVHHCCCYGFAKMVEAVILWSDSPDGEVFIDVSIDDVFNNTLHTQLPDYLHSKVVNSRVFGENLFYAHLNFMRSKRQEMSQKQMHNEVLLLFHWIPWFGMVYAISKGLHP